jgi:hypothetical protein
MFLAREAYMLECPHNSLTPAAFGDLLAALLALIAIPAVLRNARAGRLLVWLFNVEGRVDLLAAITLAKVYGASSYMGVAY